MGKYANIVYYPSLSIAENAALNKVQEKDIRYCNVGIYSGNNVMGKILTYIKQCLHDQTIPDIDYDLLESKQIHIYGKLIDFKNR